MISPDLANLIAGGGIGMVGGILSQARPDSKNVLLLVVVSAVLFIVLDSGIDGLEQGVQKIFIIISDHKFIILGMILGWLFGNNARTRAE